MYWKVYRDAVTGIYKVYKGWYYLVPRRDGFTRPGVPGVDSRPTTPGSLHLPAVVSLAPPSLGAVASKYISRGNSRREYKHHKKNNGGDREDTVYITDRGNSMTNACISVWDRVSRSLSGWVLLLDTLLLFFY